MSLTLDNISQDILVKVDEILEAGVDSPEAEALFAELDKLYGDRENKVLGYIHLIRQAAALNAQLRREAQAFYARAKTVENLGERLKGKLHSDMILHDENEIEAGFFNVRRQLSSPSVQLTIDPDRLPEKYQNVQVSANKVRLKDALKSGVVIDGVELKRKEHVRINFKRSA